MLHYHVWFNLKPGVSEPQGLASVRRFLTQVCRSDEAATFELLRNNGAPPRSKLPRYHALVVFTGAEQMADAMRAQMARGVHSGDHGEMIEAVAEFHVEIFSQIEAPMPKASVGLYACEI
jgi:hypothetical protein